MTSIMKAVRPQSDISVNSDETIDRPVGNGPGSTKTGLSRLRGSVIPWEAVVSVVAAFALLELAGRTGLLSENLFPLASEVLARLVRDMGTSVFWTAIGQTLSQAGLGLIIGTAVAIPVGLLFGRVEILDQGFRPLVEFLRPIPAIAVLPLVIMTMGVGPSGAVLLASVSCFWLVLVMTIRGARSVDPVAGQAMTVFGLPRLAQIRHLILPSASPFIVTGVRIAASVSLIVAITIELLGGVPGLGKLVQRSLQSADLTGVYSYTVAAGILGVLVTLVIRRAEGFVLSWHPSQRKSR